MGKALYRSYRSKSFEEVIGQDHITRTLKNSLKAGTYSHAYLLTGPRGVGKTSVARILAHAVNKVDYPPNPPHIDIIEIDAASNRRIDEIRELRERVVIAPTNLKYKVYIIDEVHMLTREAFNALLKTLEEPPAHAIFILATTDIHKVPDTIVSRCIRFHFKPISDNDISKHLRSIAKAEKIDIDDEALELIATYSEGSFRDGIALLDQIRSNEKNISPSDVSYVLGLGSAELVTEIIRCIVGGQARQVLESLEKARAEGVNERRLINQLAKTLRQEIIDPSAGLSQQDSLELVDQLTNIGTNSDTRTALEIALLKATIKNSSVQPSLPKKTQKPVVQPEAPAVATDLNPPPTGTSSAPASNVEFWELVLENIKKKNRGLYGIARMAEVEVTDNSLILKFDFAFHYKQMSLERNKQFVHDILKKLQPNIVTVDIRQSPPLSSAGKPDDTVKNITNIFGAGEVLES